MLASLIRPEPKVRNRCHGWPALVCNSAFDIALHDAYGVLNDRPIYETYNREFMNRDLAAYLTPAEGRSCLVRRTLSR